METQLLLNLLHVEGIMPRFDLINSMTLLSHLSSCGLASGVRKQRGGGN